MWRAAGGQREALMDWCAQAGQHGVAQLAPLVFDSVDADPAAAHLLDDAANASRLDAPAALS